MKLFKLEVSENIKHKKNPWSGSQFGEEECWGFVIRAETEEQARQIAHNNAGGENSSGITKTPWLEEKYTTCTELTAEGEPEVVLRDFLAG